MYILKSKFFVLLSLGTNMGDRKKTLEQAIETLIKKEVIYDIKVSSFYETEPYGVTDQDWFMNVCVVGHTDFPAYPLLHNCQRIEKEFGRVEREKWNKRELDIDIIFLAKENFDEKELTIPHKEYRKRKFVLIPAAEIAGDYVPPGTRKNLAKLAEECKDKSEVRKLEE